MFRRYTGKDELFSNVIVSFILLLLFVLLLYPRVIVDENYDYDTYLFIGLGGLSVLLFFYTVIYNMVYWNREYIDIEVDIEHNELKFRNNKKVYKFDDVKLFGRNKEKKQTRIYVDKFLIGFHDAALRDSSGIEISTEDVDEVGKHAITVVHRRLYNFNLLGLLFFLAADFIFFFFTKSFTLIGFTVLSWMFFSFTVLLYIILVVINKMRIKRLLNPKVEEIE